MKKATTILTNTVCLALTGCRCVNVRLLITVSKASGTISNMANVNTKKAKTCLTF